MHDLDELKALLANATYTTKRTLKGWGDGWWFHDGSEMPGHDFNREIVEAGAHEKYPDGALSIMCNWDFSCVAVLPLWARHIPLPDIIKSVFPDIENPRFYPDTGDYWWTAKGDDSLEVPGEPFEIWDHIVYLDGHATTERFNSYESLEEAIAAESKMRMSMTTGIQVTIEFRHWQNGVRSTIKSMPPTNITFTPPRPPRTADWLKPQGLTA